MDVGKLIAEARVRAGMSKAELSRRSGVDVGHIARLERGATANPTIEMIVALARGLGRRVSLTLPVDRGTGS